jgi:predicted Fe-S protein YdhL (DUF1289 family)
MRESKEKSTSQHGYPASPCDTTCTLDDRKVCQGCKRTIDEIVNWTKMTAEEQWAVVDALPGREPG